VPEPSPATIASYVAGWAESSGAPVKVRTRINVVVYMLGL
jgi:hypothetical protein